MIVCPNCQQRNTDDKAFCADCGASLADASQRVCPACGAVNEIDSLFCHRCLSDLAPLPAHAEGDATSDGPREAETTKDQAPESDPLDARTPTDDVAPAFLVPGAPTEPVDVTSAEPADEDHEMAWLGDVARDDKEQDAKGQDEPVPAGSSEEQAALPAEEQSVAPYEPPERVIRVDKADLVKPQVLAPLNELQHAIPIETAIALPHRARPHKPDQPPEIERQDAGLFERIATEPASLAVPAHTLVPERRRGGSRWGSLMLGLLVLAVVIVPRFTGGMLRAWVSPRPKVDAAAETIAGIPADETVLVAFDYTPGYAGEIDPMAQAVLHQVARQGCRVVAISTEPAGVAIGAQVLTEIAKVQPGFAYGQEYVVLGYVPGEEAGLRALAQTSTGRFRLPLLQLEDDIPSLDAMGDSVDLQSIEHVVILAQESRQVQRWIEQVGVRTDWSLHAIVPTRVRPALVPYEQSGQLATLLGAADITYEYRLAAGLPKSPGHELDVQALVPVLAMLIAIVANAVAISRHSGDRKQS